MSLMTTRFGNQKHRTVRSFLFQLCFQDHRLGRCSHDATIYSTMFTVKVDRDEDLALHDQVAAEIRRAIAEGEAAAGERLPPARDLAAVLDVNTNTVLRALRVLRDEGLLEFRRGRGVTVAGTPERGAVLSRARDLVEFARRHGYRRQDVIDMIAELP
jgi:GntR family transcriptional regulator